MYRKVIAVKEKYEKELLRIDGVVAIVAHPDKLVVMVETEDVCSRIPPTIEGVPVECKVVGRVSV